MKERLKQIIEYKTGGKQKDFAALMGWSTQYLNRLLKDGAIGLTPVATILEKLPEISSRWLILGQGTMLLCPSSVVDAAHKILDLEQYIPVMDAEEIDLFAHGCLEWTDSTISQWKQKLAEKQMYLNNIITCAYARQEEICRQQTLKS